MPGLTECPLCSGQSVPDEGWHDRACAARAMRVRYVLAPRPKYVTPDRQRAQQGAELRTVLVELGAARESAHRARLDEARRMIGLLRADG